MNKTLLARPRIWILEYPGVVYFRTVADVQKAVKILGKKLLPLFE